MHYVKQGCCWFLKKQNGTKQLFLFLGVKSLEHGSYLYLSLGMNGQSVLSSQGCAADLHHFMSSSSEMQYHSEQNSDENQRWFQSLFKKCFIFSCDFLSLSSLPGWMFPGANGFWAWLLKPYTGCFKLSCLSALDPLSGSAMRTLPLYTQQGKDPSLERESLYYKTVHNKTDFI